MNTSITPEEIKTLRKRYGLTQQAFAKLLGMGEATLNRYEKGVMPTKANENLLRAAMIPEFIADCLAREGSSLSEKQRESVQQVIYSEVTSDSKGEIMDVNELYALTLQQEVLNEKASDILADIVRGKLEAEANNDDARMLIYNDMLMQIAALKPKIATYSALDYVELGRIDGELNCLSSLLQRSTKKAA